MKLKSIRSSHAHHLPVCQLVVVIDDGQQIDRVADTVTVQVRVSYSAVSCLFGAFEHRFLRQFSQIEDKNEPGFLNSILVAGPVAVLLY